MARLLLGKDWRPEQQDIPCLMDPILHCLDMDLQLIINNFTSQTVSFPSFQTLATSVHCNITDITSPGRPHYHPPPYAAPPLLYAAPQAIDVQYDPYRQLQNQQAPGPDVATLATQPPPVPTIAQIGKYSLVVCVLLSCKHSQIFLYLYRWTTASCNATLLRSADMCRHGQYSYQARRAASLVSTTNVV